MISARPSFAWRVNGERFTRRRASSPGKRLSSTQAWPSPSRTADMCAKGTKSPLAPTEPCWGTAGMTRRLNISASSSTSWGRTPEYPFMSALALRRSMVRLISLGANSPTPAQWLRMRFRWSSETRSGEMETSASLPNPVLMPYTAWPRLTTASTTSRLAATARNCCGSRATFSFSRTALTTASMVRCFPSSRITTSLLHAYIPFLCWFLLWPKHFLSINRSFFKSGAVVKISIAF